MTDWKPPDGRKPKGRVLIRHDPPDAETKLCAALGVEPGGPNVTIGQWGERAWRDDRWRIIQNVTGWMPLPDVEIAERKTGDFREVSDE